MLLDVGYRGLGINQAKDRDCGVFEKQLLQYSALMAPFRPAAKNLSVNFFSCPVAIKNYETILGQSCCPAHGSLMIGEHLLFESICAMDISASKSSVNFLSEKRFTGSIWAVNVDDTIRCHS
jgi:hypothetical protein